MFVVLKYLLFLSFISFISCKTWYISPFGNNQNSGSSPSSAFADLKTALGYASSGDIIRAASGYYSGSSNVLLTLDGITLIGTSGSAVTIFEGEAAARPSYMFTLSGSASIKGITLSTAETGVIFSTGNRSTTLTDIVFTNFTSNCISTGSTEEIVLDKVTSKNSYIAVDFTLNSSTTKLNIMNSYFENCENGILCDSSIVQNITITNSEFNGKNQIANAFLYDNSGFNNMYILIINTTIYNYNNEENNGVALYVSAENVDLHINNIYVENITCNDGCGVYVDGGTTTIENSYFGSNNALYGGGIFTTRDAELTVFNTIFAKNYADFYGSGIYASGYMDIEYCTFLQNEALYGGGIYYYGVSNYTSSIKQSTFTLNNANSGGGIFHNAGSLSVQLAQFNNNTVISSGGGIYVEGVINLDEIVFQDNSASEGGGLFVIRYPNSVNLKLGTFQNNYATVAGGGIYCDQDAGILMDFTYFTLNSAPESEGGAYFCGSCSVTKSHVRVDPNNEAGC